MNRLLAILLGATLAVSAHAQVTANSPAIGQAVSGNNATAGGTSGTGLHTDGTVDTGSKQQAIANEAAGVNARGQTVGKGTAVIGTTAENRDKTNAEATYATPQRTPAISAKGPIATKSGDLKARKEMKRAARKLPKKVPRSINRKGQATLIEKGKTE